MGSVNIQCSGPNGISERGRRRKNENKKTFTLKVQIPQTRKLKVMVVLILKVRCSAVMLCVMPFTPPSPINSSIQNKGLKN